MDAEEDRPFRVMVQVARSDLCVLEVDEEKWQKTYKVIVEVLVTVLLLQWWPC
jgi:hypothetical protein